MHLLELTCQEHPSLEVQYGGIGGFIAKKPPKRVDPMKVIQVCNGRNSPQLIFMSNCSSSFETVPLQMSLNLSEGLLG